MGNSAMPIAAMVVLAIPGGGFSVLSQTAAIRCAKQRAWGAFRSGTERVLRALLCIISGELESFETRR